MTQQLHTSLNFETHLSQSTGKSSRVAMLWLDRPEQANAFSAQMMDELTHHFEGIQKLPDVRLLVLQGRGKHFSAGADLNWMQASAKLTFEENIEDATRLANMFKSLQAIRIPKIAAITGAVYGGAVGLVACCDYALADQAAKFCLSEARLGLLPAVIAPYLQAKISTSVLHRLALTSRVFTAVEAKDCGLIAAVTHELDTAVKDEIKALLTCGPSAQQAILKLFKDIASPMNVERTEQLTVQAIAQARTSAEGQAGLRAFFEKTNPPWN